MLDYYRANIPLKQYQKKGWRFIVCNPHGEYYPQFVGEVCPRCLDSRPVIDWSDPLNWPPYCTLKLITSEEPINPENIMPGQMYCASPEVEDNEDTRI